MRTDFHHVDIGGRIWEINIPEKKALLRSQASLNDEQRRAVKPVSEEIEDYITLVLHFRYVKKIRDTKLIFSEFPICNYIERNARNDNPDAYIACVEMAALATNKGYRCPQHIHS